MAFAPHPMGEIGLSPDSELILVLCSLSDSSELLAVDEDAELCSDFAAPRSLSLMLSELSHGNCSQSKALCPSCQISTSVILCIPGEI